jgi:hypothetical protein
MCLKREPNPNVDTTNNNNNIGSELAPRTPQEARSTHNTLLTTRSQAGIMDRLLG